MEKRLPEQFENGAGASDSLLCGGVYPGSIQ